MEANKQQSEYAVVVEGPAAFLDAVFETIEAHISRTREEYAEVITGVSAVDVGDVDHEDEAVLHLYVLGSVDRDEARELINIALNRIADEHDMVLARQGVQLSFDEEEIEGER